MTKMVVTVACDRCGEVIAQDKGTRNRTITFQVFEPGCSSSDAKASPGITICSRVDLVAECCERCFDDVRRLFPERATP